VLVEVRILTTFKVPYLVLRWVTVAQKPHRLFCETRDQEGEPRTCIPLLFFDFPVPTYDGWTGTLGEAVDAMFVAESMSRELIGFRMSCCVIVSLVFET
jgi:hypothetical protein